MLHFRMFFAIFSLLFGIASFVTFTLIFEDLNWWFVAFLFSSIATLSCLNAFIGTFFGMSTTDTGKICMQTRHPFYRWTDQIFKMMFELATVFAPKYMKNKCWSGVITGCNLFWLLMPLVVLEFMVAVVIFLTGVFLYLLFMGNMNLETISWTPLIYMAAFLVPLVIIALIAEKFKKLARMLAFCYFAIIGSLGLYSLVDVILEKGIFFIIWGFGGGILFIGAIIAIIAITVWVAIYIYHVIPMLRNSAFGQLIASAKKGICPVAVPCPINEVLEK